VTPTDAQEFEEWWAEHGQFCRAGGGDYEKAFAYHAWRRLADKLERTTAALSEAREALESCQEGYFRDNGFEVLRMDYDKEAVNTALATIRELDGSA